MDRLLFIGPGFYNYDLIILEYLRKFYRTDYIRMVPFPNSAFLNRNCRKLESLNLRRLNKKLEKLLVNNCYKKILMIDGDHIDNLNLNRIASIKETETIHYAWDSWSKKPNLKNITKHFDKSFSFDLIDVQENKFLKYLPLFNIEKDLKVQESNKKFKFLHVGWLHSDRLLKLNNIKKLFKFENVEFMVHLKTGLINKIFVKENILNDWVKLNKLTYEAYMQKLDECDCVIDFSHSNQSGYSMRVIESISKNKKLITDNPHIVKANFYDPQNIMILDKKKNKKEILEFISQPTKIYDQSIIKLYNIESWLKTLLN